ALAALVPDLLAPEGGILVSNPRRRDAPRFQEILESRGFAASTRGATARQGERDIEVSIRRFKRTS
ncbi:MAG: hypothetical protein WA990_15940, partial [Rubrobacteraceae bacterium]